MGFLDNVKSAGQTLTGIANRATSAVTPTVSGGALAAAAVNVQPERLQSALVNMTLPDEVAGWLTPPLTSLNFELGKEEIAGAWGAAGRSYHVIKNASGQQRVILHILRDVLEDSSGWAAVNAIPTSITAAMKQQPPQPTPQPLLVVSEGLDAPHVAYSLMVGPFWESQHGLKMCFVPWRHIEQLRGTSEAELKRWLPILLKIVDMQSAPARRIREIVPDDADALVRVLGRVRAFADSGATAWVLFFQQSGLEEIAGQFNFDDPVDIVAPQVVNRLKWYAPLPSNPNAEVLALFVVGIWRRDDLNEVDRKRIETIMDTYNIPRPRAV